MIPDALSWESAADRGTVLILGDTHRLYRILGHKFLPTGDPINALERAYQQCAEAVASAK
ncbi:MAG: hypothetical protein WDO13_12030 [Verrucomicrobiota bacterium]